MVNLWKRGFASTVLVAGLIMSVGLSGSESLAANTETPVWNFAGVKAGGQTTGTVALENAKALAAGDKVVIHLPYVDLSGVVSSGVVIGGSGCSAIATADSSGLGASVTCTLGSGVNVGNMMVAVGQLVLPKFVVVNQSADVIAAGRRLDAQESVQPESDLATSVRVAVYPISSGVSGSYTADLVAQLVDASGDATDNGGNVISLGFNSSNSSAVFGPYAGAIGPNGASDYASCSGPGTAGAVPSDAALGEVVCQIQASSAKVPVSVDSAGYSFESPQPMVGVGSTQVASIGAAAYDSYLVTKTGGLLSIGENPLAELGNASTVAYATSPVPATLPAGVTIASVVGGGYFTLALTSAGSVLAWGQNDQGQAGGGTSSLDVATPQPSSIPTGIKVTQVAAGCNSAYALTSTGQVYAWGADYAGQLGDGGRAQQDSPVLVGLPTGIKVTQVAAGCNSAYALTSTGQVYAWGSDSVGELGNGSQSGSLSSPVLVQMPTGVQPVQLSAGNADGYVLTSTHEIYGWGTNALGQLGNGSQANADIPTRVLMPSVDITSVVGGGFNAFAITSTHQLYAWGGNYDGQDGVGSTIEQYLPVRVSMPGSVGVLQVNGASAGGFAAMALGTNGVVYTWGANFDAQLGNGVLTTGYHSLALSGDGQLYAWGDNRTQGFGVASPGGSTVPVNVGLSETLSQLASGCDHSLALTSTGQVYAWGANQDGQLGTGTLAPSDSPVLVGLTAKAQGVWAGYNQSFAEVNGTLYGWGSNTTGQLGTGGFFNVLNPLPVALPAGQSVTSVSSPGVSTLFSLANGEVYGVGGNLFGQLGDNSLLTVAAPVVVDANGVDLYDAVMGGYPNYSELYPTDIATMSGAVSLTKLEVG